MKKKDDKKAITKVSGLSARVAKADELRRAHKRLADKATRTLKTAKEEMANASTPEERAAVRKRFLKRIDATKIESRQAWNRRYKKQVIFYRIQTGRSKPLQVL